MQDKTLEHEQQSCFIIILRYFYNFFLNEQISNFE